MRYFNRAENPNTLAGIFLLILLAVFAGPTVFPQLIATSIPFADEGVPCDWLRTGENRAYNQSLLGREISQRSDPPISLSVRTSNLPATQEDTMTFSIIVTNNTLGTIPILVSSGQLIFDPNQAASGFGVVFGIETASTAIPNVGENTTSYPESRIHLLGPRQICVHRVAVPFNQLPNSQQLNDARAVVKAFYRNNTVGVAVPTGNQPAVYSDQGLWTGVVESAPRTVGGTVQ